MVTTIAKASLVCGCKSKQIDILHAYVVQSDELVAKALALSEVARIARTEVRLREYLLAKWRTRSVEAAAAADYAIRHGGGTPAAAVSVVNKTMARWASDVSETYTIALEKAYRLARVAGFKKATGKTKASLQYGLVAVSKAKPTVPKSRKAELSFSFDLPDKHAIAALQKQEMLWIGEHYGENVSGAIKEAVNVKLIEGLGREAAGALVRSVVEEKLKGVFAPSGWRGTDTDYFEGLAANAVTNARVQGQMESFARVKVTTYEIVNPLDSRTTPFCEDINGTTFSVRDGMDQLDRLRAAKTPDEVRAAHPWMSLKAAKGIRGKGGTKAMAQSGLALPPYHFRCRSTVDVASESTSYDSLDD